MATRRHLAYWWINIKPVSMLWHTANWAISMMQRMSLRKLLSKSIRNCLLGGHGTAEIYVQVPKGYESMEREVDDHQMKKSLNIYIWRNMIKYEVFSGTCINSSGFV
jgi:hypothetical protein